MLGAMGMLGSGITFSTDQHSPISFPSPVELFKTPILQNNNKKIVQDVECTPTKAKKAKLSILENSQVQQVFFILRERRMLIK